MSRFQILVCVPYLIHASRPKVYSQIQNLPHVQEITEVSLQKVGPCAMDFFLFRLIKSVFEVNLIGEMGSRHMNQIRSTYSSCNYSIFPKILEIREIFDKNQRCFT